ncbi:MAG: hypothetical protein LBQ34_02635 [Alphaproteobacteria bacterium]|jgi:hypothetical protein|nr:hypothetical protein [Alphaproteobacteria bacterium]
MSFNNSVKQIEHKFLILFPGGFSDTNWLKLVKKHSSTKVDNLFQDALNQAKMQENTVDSAIEAIQKAANYSTTISMFEKFALRNYLTSKDIHTEFVEILYKFMYEDYQKYFAEFTHVLSKTKNSINNSNCAKWSIVSFFLAFSNKNQHVFLKPTTAKRISAFFETDIAYQSYPNLETYEKFRNIIFKFKENSSLVKDQELITVQAVIFCALSMMPEDFGTE